MNRVLLINPHETEQDGYTNPPLGLLYLAGTLTKNAFDVKILDACIEGKGSIVGTLDEFRPGIVGITCLTPGRLNALEVARRVKDFNPSITVVLGGVHPTIMYRQLLEHYDCIDLVVLGEGEETLLEIAKGLKWGAIAGVAYRDGSEIRKTAPRPNISDLDKIPFPAWDLIDLSHYRPWGNGKVRGIDLEREPRVSVVFSRGCPGRCDFCSTWWIWKGWRHRSPSNMVDEIEMLYRNHGVRHFCFADDAMTVDRQATIDLCDEILRRHLVIAFHVTTRTDCVDEELLLKLKLAGCYMIAFGIETGSLELLTKMDKKNDIENSEQAIALCKKIGLTVTALLIVGNVGETEKTVLETLGLLKRSMPDEVGCAGALWILPGTKLYQDCRRRGIIDDSFWLGSEPYMSYTEEHSPEALEGFVRTINGYKGPYRKMLGKVKKVFQRLGNIKWWVK